MTKVKEFFKIEGRYKFEYNDLRCLITVINVVLIMIYGLSIAWFGLAMHLSSVALNIYFIILLYCG